MAEQSLVGILERITYQNPENGFLIGRLKPEASKTPITVKGSMFNVREGQTLKVWGGWEEHPEYGRQFAVSAFLVPEPTTREGMERYLASGIIKGVGAVLAKRIVSTFGDNTFQVIDETPDKLLEVPKFSRRALAAVKKTWQEQKAIREIMVFLHAQGISQAYGERIFNTYGFGSVEVLKENPYRLALDVRGIGFRIADSIARNLGVAVDSPQRAEGGVIYVLEELSGQGHTGCPQPKLIERAQETLEVGREPVAEAVDRLVADGLLKALPRCTFPRWGGFFVPAPHGQGRTEHCGRSGAAGRRTSQHALQQYYARHCAHGKRIGSLSGRGPARGCAVGTQT